MRWAVTVVGDGLSEIILNGKYPNTQFPFLLSFNYCCECIGRDIKDLTTPAVLRNRKFELF